MSLHLTSLNLPSAFVFALDNSLRAFMRNMFFHVVQWKHQTTFEKTFHNPEGTLLIFVPLQIFSQNFSARVGIVVWTRNKRVWATF